MLHTGEGGEQAEISWRGLYASHNGWRGLHRSSFKSQKLLTYYTPIMPASCTLDPSALRWTAGGPGSWLVTLESNRLEVRAQPMQTATALPVFYVAQLRARPGRMALIGGCLHSGLVMLAGDQGGGLTQLSPNNMNSKHIMLWAVLTSECSSMSTHLKNRLHLLQQHCLKGCTFTSTPISKVMPSEQNSACAVWAGAGSPGANAATASVSYGRSTHARCAVHFLLGQPGRAAGGARGRGLWRGAGRGRSQRQCV